MRKLPLFWGVAGPVVILAVILAGLWWLWGERVSDDVTAPPSAEGPSEAEEMPSDGRDGPDGSEADAGRLTLWLDGWSHRTLEGSELSVSFGDESRRPLGSVPLTFESATADDLSTLAEVDPVALARLMARMVRYDPLLRCEADGCVSQRGEVPLEWLADLSQVPVFADMFDAWDVEVGALRVEVAVPEGAVFAAVGAPGLSPVILDLVGLVEGEPDLADNGSSGDVAGLTPPDAPAGLVLDGDPAAAAPSSDRVLSAAFGVLFELAPQWLEDEGIFAGLAFFAPPVVFSAASAEQLPAALEDNEQLLSGLSARVPELAGATPELLTLLSSPTFGCYVALCVPTDVRSGSGSVEVVTLGSAFGRACVRDGFLPLSGLFEEDIELLAVASDQLWRVEVGRPFHQTGLWGGLAASELTGYLPGGVGAFTGDPVLIDAPLEVRMFTTWLYSGSQLQPHLVEVREVPLGSGPVDRWDDLVSLFESC